MRAKHNSANCIFNNHITYVYKYYNYYTHNEIFVFTSTSAFHASLRLFKIIQNYYFILFNMFLSMFYYRCGIMFYTRSKIISLIVMNPYTNYFGYITTFSSGNIKIIWHFILNKLFNFIYFHFHNVVEVISFVLTYIYHNVYMWHFHNCNKCKNILMLIM